jgi:hypothetical protein
VTLHAVCVQEASQVTGETHLSVVSELLSSQSASALHFTSHDKWLHTDSDVPGFLHVSVVSGLLSSQSEFALQAIAE